MPATTKKSTKPRINWEDVLSSLQNEGGAGFIFPKGNRTRVRLLQGEGQAPYTTVESSYNGNIKTKYLLPAIQPDAEGDDADKVKALIVPKTVFRSIVQLANEGYDLWDPAEGYGITILRQGTGLETTYSVMPSQKVIPVDHDLVASIDIDAMAQDYVDFQEKSSKKSAKAAESDTESDY